MVTIELYIPIRSKNQQVSVLQLACEKLQKQQRRLVRPVQVLEEENERLPLRTIFRKRVRLSKKRNRACSDSTPGGVGRSGRRSRTSGMTCAISAPPAPISVFRVWTSQRERCVRTICTQGQK